MSGSAVAQTLVGGRAPEGAGDAGVGRDDADDVRLLAADEPAISRHEVEAAITAASEALDVLAMVAPAMVAPADLDLLAGGLERLGRRVEWAATRVAGHVELNQPFTDDGVFSARSWSKHRLGTSGAQAHRRSQCARLHRRVGLWEGAAASGLVGTAQTALMARVAANPRITDADLDGARFDLLTDAMELPYDEFERRVRRWESLVDVEGAAGRAERTRDRRDFRLRPRPDGSWAVSGRLDGVAGAELNEVLSHFIDAEWRADWSDGARRGVTTTSELCRTQNQRHADALIEMARCAAAAAGRAGQPTVDLLLDIDTFRATVTGQPISPGRYRDVVCRSRAGTELHPTDVANVALWAHVRRVVHDSAGTIIDLGRRRRFFSGSARNAVMLLETSCVWVGCDQPVAWCQADHSLAWAAHGATVPRNGQPLCGRHNRHKQRGYRVFRDEAGVWHTLHPDGHEIG